MIFLTLFLIVCLFLIYWNWKQRKYYKLYNKIGCSLRNWPLIGQTYIFMGSREDRMKGFQLLGKIALKQGGLTGMWMGLKMYVVLADPELIEHILKICLEKDEIINASRDLLGDSSIFAPVSIWRPRRKVNAPTFSMKRLNGFVKVFARQSSVMVEQLKGAAGNGTFSVWKNLTTYTMDSVCETTLGINVGAQQNTDQPFLEAFEGHCKMSSVRICLPIFIQRIYKFLPMNIKFMKYTRTMKDYVDRVVKKKRAELNTNIGKEVSQNNCGNTEDSQHSTFLEAYIESSGFTDLEVREECLAFILAGTDTSAVGTGFTCLMIAMHQDIQHKVYEELQEVFGSSNRPVEPEDLSKLKYLEAVIKESLRLYPPVPLIVREVDRDIKLPSGLEIPKGTGIFINIWAVHRNPKYWGQDADEFNPDRFLEARTHSAAFMPFSHGPRSCLGYQYAMMSMKTALATLLRRYRLLPAAQHPAAEASAPLRVAFNIMLKHVDNFELQLENRM